MLPFLHGVRFPRVVLVLGLALGTGVAGCGPPTTPPGLSADELARMEKQVREEKALLMKLAESGMIRHLTGTSASGVYFTFLKSREGLTVLLVDDVKDGHSLRESWSTGDTIHVISGVAGSVDAGGYTWQIKTKDGKSAACQINGKDYDLSEDGLFVVKGKKNKAEVHYIKRDLAAIPFDADRCKDPIQNDADVRRLLEFPDLPK